VRPCCTRPELPCSRLPRRGRLRTPLEVLPLPPARSPACCSLSHRACKSSCCQQPHTPPAREPLGPLPLDPAPGACPRLARARTCLEVVVAFPHMLVRSTLPRPSSPGAEPPHQARSWSGPAPETEPPAQVNARWSLSIHRTSTRSAHTSTGSTYGEVGKSCWWVETWPGMSAAAAVDRPAAG
jgi:hypothetical protein